MKKWLAALTLVLISSVAFALSPEKAKYLKDNGIILVTQPMEERYIDEFLLSYQKFPTDLAQELIKLGRKIHLIQGHGVSDDPTWDDDLQTFDGRDWSTVPGAGGKPFWHWPTRIVVNRLKEGHGSRNLFLHEEAHAMDLSYGIFKISRSSAFQELLKTRSFLNYMEEVCPGYCEVPQEAFAELFARYYADGASRKKLQRSSPQAFNFIKNLRSIREASEKGQDASGE